MRPDNPADEFEQVFAATSTNVLAYCLRHLPRADAEDVVGETYVIAWRRWHQAQPTLPWLLGVARNIIRAQHRAAHRRFALNERLQQWDALTAPAAEVSALDRANALSALAALSDDDREALLLTAWDGLTAAEAAGVLGCSKATFQVRLHRARRRLDLRLAEPQGLAIQPQES
ncbi:MAG: sigma-70 family RNA polymerase sigma factor [Propionibacteriaceae bacterium]|nr:sigma-70 family RNA polymerase sigma factor [Propionibacteriaceae bacterium]